MKEFLIYCLMKQWWNIGFSLFLIFMGIVIAKRPVLWNIILQEYQGYLVGGTISITGIIYLVTTLAYSRSVIKENKNYHT
ncbi:hypothetical protein [Thiohalophilus thiocyanatoxydans]|uniref:hypothetical protein n=1 Tax=Thiohalophilus thiocyanatoxydans TaxID=381308 RepID=UPI001064C3A9|nr:hypothetical protein [Thiohalophilus thiocyanatoxydans]